MGTDREMGATVSRQIVEALTTRLRRVLPGVLAALPTPENVETTLRNPGHGETWVLAKDAHGDETT